MYMFGLSNLSYLVELVRFHTNNANGIRPNGDLLKSLIPVVSLAK